jgi:hypothetical protein
MKIKIAGAPPNPHMCPVRPPLDGSEGNPMGWCLFLANHVARHSWDRRVLQQLLDEGKSSAAIHFDEDTIPHGQCEDPVHCDCMCPSCWSQKVHIIRGHVIL